MLGVTPAFIRPVCSKRRYGDDGGGDDEDDLNNAFVLNHMRRTLYNEQ